MTSLVPAAMQRVSDFSSALVHINTLRSALLDAVHGRLSTFLISDTMMAHTMGRITRELKTIHPAICKYG